MIGGSMKCIKYLLFVFNLLFAISGLALIITGAVVQAKASKYLDFLGETYLNTPILLVVVGCIIFCVAFFGCCGAIKENHCMTITFSILLTFILLLEIGAGIAAYMLKNDLRNVAKNGMEKGLQNYGKPGHEGVTRTWDVVQHEMNCCGTKGYNDWANVTYMEGSVPDSCCISDVEGCGKGVLNKPESDAANTVNLKGCLNSFEEKFIENVAAVGGIGVAVAFIQAIGVIFACCLARSIKKEYQEV